MSSFSVSASVGFFSLANVANNPSTRTRKAATANSSRPVHASVSRIPSMRKSRVKRLPLNNFDLRSPKEKQKH